MRYIQEVQKKGRCRISFRRKLSCEVAKMDSEKTQSQYNCENVAQSPPAGIAPTPTFRNDRRSNRQRLTNEAENNLAAIIAFAAEINAPYTPLEAKQLVALAAMADPYCHDFNQRYPNSPKRANSPQHLKHYPISLLPQEEWTPS